MWRSIIPTLLVAATLLVAQGPARAARGEDQAPLTSFGFGGPTGIRRCRPDFWGTVSVEVTHRSRQPADVLVTMYFDKERNLQYARQLWVPPRARRRSWCPIVAPRSIPSGVGIAELKSRLYDRSGPTELLLTSPSELRFESRMVRIDHDPLLTAMIYEGEPGDRAASDLLVAARMGAGLSPAWYDLLEDFLPPAPECLHGVDQLVLLSDRLASDAAGLAAVRRWLHRGGRLWIMLDRVDPATVELLLGNAFGCHVVDRVGLTRVEISDVTPMGARYRDQPREFDDPVELVRVLTTGVEVHQTANGWPASFWQRVGRGRVLFTTLGPHGWMRHRTERDPKAAPEFGHIPFAATEPLAQLARELFKPRRGPILDPRQFEPYLAEQIGYQVVPRRWVTAMLGGFCLILVTAGVWLGHRKRLEQMAWIGPAAAGLATLALVVMGLRAKQVVPGTVAVGQLVEVEPGIDDVSATGLAAIYSQRESGAAVGAERGGVFWPDMTGLGGTARRMVRTDLDAWHWENLTLPAGVRTAPFQYGVQIDRPIEAHAIFGPEGLTGSVKAGPFEDLADAIVATPWRGQLAAELEGDGTFAAGADAALAPGQFISGGLLSDEQRRRQSIYQQLLPGGGDARYPERPMVLVWAKPLDMHFTFPSAARRVGSALLAVPLEIDRSPPGTRIVIPSPFLDYRAVSSPRGERSATYSSIQREWLERRSPSNTCLRFQIPPQVLPVQLEHATLTVQINAPSRDLEITGWAAKAPITLARRSGPVGTQQFEIDQADVLQLDDQGGLLLAIDVGGHPAAASGDTRSSMASPAWKIEAVRLEVSGQTLERPAK